ncbi:MAG: methionine--tRNA ligase [Planctomycetota bacterium]
MARRIFTTAALIYANGSVHLGHLVEYTIPDIWTRFQKMIGNECIYCCAEDTHGTPIMVWAKKEGKPPEELIEQVRMEHLEDFSAFEIVFDSYHSTNSEENRRLTEEIFKKNLDAGFVKFKDVQMFFCEKDAMFLPDRFVRGICPKCKAEDQYGDHCEICNAPYHQTELMEPACTVCGSTPRVKTTEHAFFTLSAFGDRINDWLNDHINPEIANELRSKWIEPGLRDWDFTRDAPYFGFEVPGHAGLYFYVWWDAPIGYIASLQNYCKQSGQEMHSHWLSGDTEVVHFIGKDIAYHHGIYWPAMLMGAGYPLPRVRIHGFLTVDGAKMSKSRGTFINARTYRKHLDPQYLRYYFACKIGPNSADLDLSFDDLEARINSDLVGKIANLPSRSATMIKKTLDGRLGKIPDEARGLMESLKGASEEIAAHYENLEYSEVTRKICQLADQVNVYIDNKKPWHQIKSDPEGARETHTVTLNATRILSIYLKPILPGLSRKIEKLLNTGDLQWKDIPHDLEGTEIGNFKHLIQRVDPKKVEAMIQETQAKAAEDAGAKKKDRVEKVTEPVFCSIDDFMKVELKVARIVEAHAVEGADKLLQLIVDVGEERKRTVFAGIKSAYDPEELVGRLVVVATNLAPRKMKFGISEGMALAAGEGGKDIHLISPDEGAVPGQRIH